jgi:hyaluronoglucosaminidase
VAREGGGVIRGVIEGFYGPPWTQAERLDMVAFCGAEALDTWVHAPKDDPYHRKLWREPYPDAQLEQLAQLVRACERHGVEFAYAIAPGLDVCYSSDDELATLIAKCDQLRSIGVRTFQLLWDDIEHELHCAADEERYGGSVKPSGAAQADFSNRFRAAYLGDAPLVVCPLGYAGVGPTPYREAFGGGLDEGTIVYWTGPDIVPKEITRAQLDGAVEAFGHELLIWDNYPVNDFDPARLFLGPLRSRDATLFEGRCAGLIANAMLQAVPSKLALATVADYLRDPGGYDPDASFERALRAYGAEVLEALRALPQASLARSLAPGLSAAAALALLEPRL